MDSIAWFTPNGTEYSFSGSQQRLALLSERGCVTGAIWLKIISWHFPASYIVPP